MYIIGIIVTFLLIWAILGFILEVLIFSNFKFKGSILFKAFNCFQLTCFVALGPILLGWLDNATFKYAGPAWWVCVVSYVVAFIANIVLTANSDFN